ncbi:hypothetical protein QBC40DRAFT_91263 [Triangularia verruculosa]|uniref:Transmembrane protein n=1 Tax=Triangularia verruculosa TaxID=2587418 RepID=A0AAN7AYQ9_9PEZI|nr:hypothetical protein QBC40DRAFT_91263 [Triangularia verruculosa]
MAPPIPPQLNEVRQVDVRQVIATVTVWGPIPTDLPDPTVQVFAGTQTVYIAPTSTSETVVVASDNSGSGGSSLNGGEIAGIVIGTLVAVILIIWLIKRLSQREKRPSYYHEESVRSGSRHRHGHHHHHHHHGRGRSRSSRSRSRSIEVREVRSPARVYTTRSRSRSRY